MATTETWKDKNTGERREKTEWHRVVIFGPVAEIAGQYLSKGKQVYIEGKLQTRKWQGQDGQDRYTTEVVVDMRGTMQMLGSRGDGGGYQGQSASQQASSGGYGAGGDGSPDQGYPQQPYQGGQEDDIPF
ncbi:hypothetical protein DSCA_40380 [Desulfosarcina alkanivorans]|jgi:single-strand DNA-binding protein|uniref:Single-stranded DNA-binding protein n=1 Tax=Desulfosarcina alkanivorans TaxID=571177 RepID=A0A5K7YMR4_9BACT|nr:hypothetical protein DSCA_40380 [Desulfosarcina alkanivorans]